MSDPKSSSIIGLSWNPSLPSFTTTQTTTTTTNNSNLLYKPQSELIDGLYLPPTDPKKLNKLARKNIKDTAGKNWFDMPAQTITSQLKKDLQLLKLRGAMDPKRFYKKGDKSKELPKYFQIGTVVEHATEFYSGRLSKKERKTTFADELLADSNLWSYRKRKVGEIEEKNRERVGVEKWKKKKKNGNGKRRRN